ncbi:MAG: DUF402 domain-containing protein [Candidatus Cloacimonetes bacterium]|nr:DUF402 domain-containing protein [Candidatus Cloacimonadota bacterium]
MNIASAISIISVKHGVQISKKFDKDNQFCYWYCDMIKTKWTPKSGCFEITDLLVDVVIFPDNELRVIDLDEFIQAKEDHLIHLDDFQWAHNAVLNLMDRALLGDFPPKAFFEPIIGHIPSGFFDVDESDRS